MTKCLSIEDFFNADKTSQENKDIKFENLIKYLSNTKKTGLKWPYTEVLDYFREHEQNLEDFNIKVLKDNLFFPTVILERDGKEYVFTLECNLVDFLENHDNRLSKLEDAIAEDYAYRLENCSLPALIEGLKGEQNTRKFPGFFYWSYGEVGILPFLLANNNRDVVKWSLENLSLIDIEKEWMEDHLDMEEDFDVNLPGFEDSDKFSLKILLTFLEKEGQEPEIIEYIRTHVKTGREILEDERTEGLRFGCYHPIIDVMVDKSIKYCSSVPDDFIPIKNYRDFRNWEECNQWLINFRNSYMQANEYFCKTKQNCNNQICQGPCIAMTEHFIRQEHSC